MKPPRSQPRRGMPTASIVVVCVRALEEHLGARSGAGGQSTRGAGGDREADRRQSEPEKAGLNEELAGVHPEHADFMKKNAELATVDDAAYGEAKRDVEATLEQLEEDGQPFAASCDWFSRRRACTAIHGRER